MPLGERGPRERGGERKAPPLKSIIPPLLALLIWKWLQRGTDITGCLSLSPAILVQFTLEVCVAAWNHEKIH